MWTQNGSFLCKPTRNWWYLATTFSWQPSQQLCTTPHNHTNVVWTTWKSWSHLLSSVSSWTLGPIIFITWTLRSTGISGGNSPPLLCGSSQLYLLPKFRSLAERMLLYSPDYPQEWRAIPAAAESINRKWPLLLSLLRNFQVKCLL